MTDLGRVLLPLSCLLLALSAQADSPIEELIEQTGIVAGEQAMRDRPGWRTPKKILIYRGWYIDPDLQSVAPAVEIVRAEDKEEALLHAADADGIIGSCENDIISAAPRLMWVQFPGAGAERCLQTDKIVAGEVVLTNMQKMSSPMIGEHAVAMVLALARSLPEFIGHMPAGDWRRWDDKTGSGMQSVHGKTMLVAGLGGIGTEAARRGAALGMRVIGTRRSSREGPDFVDYVGLSDELFELAAKADFIINALPLTSETEALFDGKFFAAAKAGAHYISVGRGKTTVTDDLVEALQSGHIAGAGLDVTDPEPLPSDHPLWQMPNVIITPHTAGRGADSSRHETLMRENVRRFVAGDALLNVVDPEAGY
ncbi:MAG: D-2-hydroxyacid dehydrogenase [Woeseiaceae bacterium]